MPKPTTNTETDAYLIGWAKQLAATIDRDELARLVKDYRQQARNKRRSADDREFARRRAKALAELVTRNS
jgi:hypothetical protein